MLCLIVFLLTGTVRGTRFTRILPAYSESYIQSIAKAPTGTPAPFLLWPQNCYFCPPGKYAATEGVGNINDCQDCPMGTFSENQGMLECSLCPNGWGTSTTGSNSRTQCQAPRDNVPTLQPTPSPTSSHHVHTPRPTLKPTPMDKASQTTMRPTFTTSCSLGSMLIQTREGISSCQSCPIGTYGVVCDGNWPAKKYSFTGPGSDKYGDAKCSFAITETTRSEYESTSTSFPRMEFNFGDHACVPCPSGFQTLSAGATEKVSCFQPVCPKGMYFVAPTPPTPAWYTDPLAIGLSVTFVFLFLCGVLYYFYVHLPRKKAQSEAAQKKAMVEMGSLGPRSSQQHPQQEHQQPVFNSIYAPHEDDQRLRRMSIEYQNQPARLSSGGRASFDTTNSTAYPSSSPPQRFSYDNAQPPHQSHDHAAGAHAPRQIHIVAARPAGSLYR